MKVFLSLAILFVTLSGTVMASEFQSIDGEEAYKLYLKLPGVACQEYRITNYVVYTKYQTKNCSINQTDASKWNCTVQFTTTNKKQEVTSANCTREI